MQQFFTSGGAQRQYMGGANANPLTPKAPLPTPKPKPTTPVPTPTTAQAAQVTPQASQQPEPVVQSTTQKGKSTLVKETLPKAGISKVELTKWEHTPTEQEIITAIGGADKTSGSCASVGLAYVGNKAGYRVHDFRGGASMDWFATKTNTEKIARLKGVDGLVIKAKNEIQTAKKMLATMQPGKEYWFGIGRHASIVRVLEDGTYQYLELQAETQYCGWRTLTEYQLQARFGCVRRRSVALPARLIDVDKLAKHPDLPEIMQYINTEVGKQRKGIGGGIK